MIGSSIAFIVYSALMAAAYVWATVKPDAPFEIFAWAFTAGFGGYIGKRLMEKKGKYGGVGCNGGGESGKEPVGD